ncbi:MAG TPA: cysteine desulfurase family protein [Bradyrhizobium sp.]|nr:cysteine desulfurase family protein [Bradyrhizobium sp.]
MTTIATKPIYLDNNGTTPVDPAVLKAMLPYLGDEFGNPSSAHALGRRARDAVEAARTEVASLIGASPDEILFTSGGTESSNIAIRGAASANLARNAIVTTAIEHPATEACCAFLESQGKKVTRIAPNVDAIVDPEKFIAAINSDTALATIIHAQNETGTLQPVAEISAAARRHGTTIHADAAQSVGKIAVDVNELGVDLLSIAGHKLYAPKGIGALYIRRGINLPPLLLGAGQEHGRRPGTENVAFIVGLGEACRIAKAQLQRGLHGLKGLADELYGGLKREIPGIRLVGHPAQRLPNTLNVLFPRVSGRRLLENCPGVFASNGSACHADSEEPSAILTALGIPAHEALGSVRLSLGRHTSRADIETAALQLVAAWRTLAGTDAATSLAPDKNFVPNSRELST